LLVMCDLLRSVWCCMLRFSRQMPMPLCSRFRSNSRHCCTSCIEQVQKSSKWRLRA
jgi:hypothetical protein